MRYTYRGDKFTDESLKRLQCDPVKGYGHTRGQQRNFERCIRGKNGNMLVVDAAGRRHVVLARQLRINR